MVRRYGCTRHQYCQATSSEILNLRILRTVLPGRQWPVGNDRPYLANGTPTRGDIGCACGPEFQVLKSRDELVEEKSLCSLAPRRYPSPPATCRTTMPLLLLLTWYVAFLADHRVALSPLLHSNSTLSSQSTPLFRKSTLTRIASTGFLVTGSPTRAQLA